MCYFFHESCYISIGIVVAGVDSMAQDHLTQDSVTNDLYVQILCVEQPSKPENTVDTRYVHSRRNCFILYTIHKKIREKSPV